MQIIYNLQIKFKNIFIITFVIHFEHIECRHNLQLYAHENRLNLTFMHWKHTRDRSKSDLSSCVNGNASNFALAKTDLMWATSSWDRLSPFECSFCCSLPKILSVLWYKSVYFCLDLIISIKVNSAIRESNIYHESWHFLFVELMIGNVDFDLKTQCRSIFLFYHSDAECHSQLECFLHKTDSIKI